MMQSPPSVLISYSWDDEDHKTWVRELAERIVINGVVVYLDQWHVKLGESLTLFMEEKITICDYVLVVCTPNYRAKSHGRRGGVGYEQQIISGEIASGVPRHKFIPIVRTGEFEIGSECAIPAHFLGIRALDMRSISVFEESFEELLRAIYGVPKYSPPALGAVPLFVASSQHGKEDTPLRLASAELDGWYLTSGVVQSELYPETYRIPSESERRSVGPGYLVKLVFEIALADPEKDNVEIFFGERMWVEVDGVKGPYLVGKLNNTPASFEGDHYLKPNAEIVFLPEHIIDIITVREKETMIEAQSKVAKKERTKSTHTRAHKSCHIGQK